MQTIDERLELDTVQEQSRGLFQTVWPQDTEVTTDAVKENQPVPVVSEDETNTVEAESSAARTGSRPKAQFRKTSPIKRIPQRFPTTE